MVKESNLKAILTRITKYRWFNSIIIKIQLFISPFFQNGKDDYFILLINLPFK